MPALYHDSPNPTTKTCTQCHITKLLDEFYCEKARKDGHKSICKVCCDAQRQGVLPANRLIQLPLCFETKHCNICQKEKPLDEFALNKSSKDGHQNRCKPCQNARYKASDRGQQRAMKKAQLIPQQTGSKVCRKCMIEKPFNEFSAGSGNDGYATQCKACRQYHQNVLRHEQALARRRKHYHKHRNSDNVHHISNLHLSINQQWRSDRCKSGLDRSTYIRLWRKNHPLYSREMGRRRRALIKGLTAEKVDYNSILKRDGLWCYLCEKDILPHHKLHFDHFIPIARGGAHAVDNIHPTHDICNLRKKDKFLSELDEYDRRGPDA